jgi:hypothetical protein
MKIIGRQLREGAAGYRSVPPQCGQALLPSLKFILIASHHPQRTESLILISCELTNCDELMISL